MNVEYERCSVNSLRAPGLLSQLASALYASNAVTGKVSPLARWGVFFAFLAEVDGEQHSRRGCKLEMDTFVDTYLPMNLLAYHLHSLNCLFVLRLCLGAYSAGHLKAGRLESCCVRTQAGSVGVGIYWRYTGQPVSFYFY